VNLLWRFIRRTLFAAAGALIAVQLGARRGLVLEVWLLVAGALALDGFVRSTRALQPTARDSAFERALGRKPRPPDRPEELLRIEEQTVLAIGNAGDAHFRLRPRLRTAAAELLALGRGLELDRDRERASAALGPDAWELVRPDRPAPDRGDRGIPLLQLEAAVTAIEEVGA
jgi:hypothetical protein